MSQENNKTIKQFRSCGMLLWADLFMQCQCSETSFMRISIESLCQIISYIFKVPWKLYLKTSGSQCSLYIGRLGGVNSNVYITVTYTIPSLSWAVHTKLHDCVYDLGNCMHLTSMISSFFGYGFGLGWGWGWGNRQPSNALKMHKTNVETVWQIGILSNRMLVVHQLENYSLYL